MLKNCEVLPFVAMSGNDYHLLAKRIDIWEFSLNLNNLPPLTTGLLDHDERERARRFYFPRHQNNFMLTRAMLRVILANYLSLEPSKLAFNYNQFGKPHLNGTIEFNLSHSGNLVLVAIGSKVPVGIDLEKITTRSYIDLASKLFTPHELQVLHTMPANLQSAFFFHVWTQKEAFAKACGLGLNYPVQNLNVGVNFGTPVTIKEQNSDWLLMPFVPKVAYRAALCCHPMIQEFRYINIQNINLLF